MTAAPLVNWWKATLRIAARDHLGRVGALVSGCAALDATLSVKIPEASALSDFKDKIDVAFQKGQLRNRDHVHWARNLRNTTTHDATVPPHLDALNAVSALAYADLNLRQSGEKAVSELESEYHLLVNAGLDDVVDAEHRFDLQDSGDILALHVASRSGDEVDRSAAILVASSLLERSSDSLIQAKLDFSDERKRLLDLGLKPKVVELFKRGWIEATEEEQQFVLDALTARNRCAHEDEPPTQEDSEQQVAAIVDVARLAANQVPVQVVPTRNPKPAEPPAAALPLETFTPPPSYFRERTPIFSNVPSPDRVIKYVVYSAGALALIMAVRTFMAEETTTSANTPALDLAGPQNPKAAPLRNVQLMLTVRTVRELPSTLSDFDLYIEAGAETAHGHLRTANNIPLDPLILNVTSPLARDARINFRVVEHVCVHCADTDETFDASRASFTENRFKNGVNISMAMTSDSRQ